MWRKTMSGQRLLAGANARLITAQSRIDVARLWGGGLLASVDGLRFVVPVRTLDAGPNPYYFGRGRGVTWLNAINDQVAGIGGVVVTGTMRDSLHVLDVILGRDGGPTPEMIATDTASYSDIYSGCSGFWATNSARGWRICPISGSGGSPCPAPHGSTTDR